MKEGFFIEINNGEILYHCSFQKEIFDNIIIDDQECFIAIKGVLLNKKSLLNQFAFHDFKELILQLFKEKKQHFFALLEGEFSGFIYEKSSKKVWVYTNVTSTQKVYYYHQDGLFLAATSIKSITQKLSAKKIKFSIDEESIYQMLTFTNIIENKTPIKDIFKVYDASFLEFDIEKNSLKEEQYYNLEIERFSGTKEKAIQVIDEIFAASVILEYQKDQEFQKEHFSLLSGGLDSRVALLYAQKHEQNPKKVFCFSQSGYLDETISREIAQKYQFDYVFEKLDGGIFLNNIDKLIAFSEGMVLYTGGIHADFAINKIDSQNIGLIHSGQIGDGVLGGFNKVPFIQKPTNQKIVVDATFSPKVSENLEKVKANYEREELFLLRNVAFNRAVFGAQVFQQVSYQTSPFMTKDFMSFAISLPEVWKFNHQFYLDWIKNSCKDATEFTWERTMMKPNANWKTKFGDQFNKRAVNLVYNKILGKEYLISMYPYQYYFNKSKELQDFYQNYFEENLHFLDEFKELQQDVIQLFSMKDFFSKSSAINVLGIFKYYNE